MASFVLRQVNDLWPDATSVDAFALDALGNRAAVATATASVSSGTLTFTGLADGTRYEAFAAGKSKRFRTDAGSGVVSERKRVLWIPAGGIDQSMQRESVSTAGATVTSGTLRVVGNLVVPAGVPVTNISFYGVGAAVTPANWWFCLIRASDLAVIGKTADQLTAAWAANTEKTLPIAGGPITLNAETAVYAGILQVAATPATLGNAGLPAALNGAAPALSGNSTTGLTDPASLGATAAAVTAAANMLYARLS